MQSETDGGHPPVRHLFPPGVAREYSKNSSRAPAKTSCFGSARMHRLSESCQLTPQRNRDLIC